VDDLLAEIVFAEHVLADNGSPRRPAATVFIGGGTPTLLPEGDIARVLDAVRTSFGIADGAEVTIEANPDTVTRESLRAFADAGVTRVSVGMQSAVPRVLSILDRTHEPASVGTAVAWAKDAGLQTSVDLIYGTPGETLDEWRTSLSAAIALETDHISAYSLKALADVVAPLMTDGGSIVGLDFDNTISWPSYDWMGVAKSAFESTSRYLARYLGPQQIRVNLVAAGPIKTIAARSIPGFSRFEDVWDERAPLGWDVRNAPGVARACVALLSDWFPQTTGEVIHVDGGYHSTGA
jgi:NAD(P)-dependent dehydrogenase (short-subunit alcohol dehydrogenase family)